MFISGGKSLREVQLGSGKGVERFLNNNLQLRNNYLCK